jgi:hypothetical protein
MGVYREVNTVVTCDSCGDEFLSWSSEEQGVSKEWAARFARREGATVGKKGVICKECRIKERQKKCAVIKTVGHPGRDSEDKCLGFDIMADCKKCIAYTGYDWEKVKRKWDE